MADPYSLWEPEESKYATPGWMSNPWFFVPWMGMEFWGNSLLTKGSISAMSTVTPTRSVFEGGRMPRGMPGSPVDIRKPTGPSPRRRFARDVKATYGEYNRRTVQRYIMNDLPGAAGNRWYKPWTWGRAAESTALGVRSRGGLLGGIAMERDIIRTAGARYGRKAATAMAAGRNILAAGRTMGLWFMAEMAVGAVDMFAQYVENRRYDMKPYGPRTLETGGGFVDTRDAQTQRARALQAIHNSQMTTRAVIGNEAAMMHWNG